MAEASVYSARNVFEGLKRTFHQYLEAQYHIWDFQDVSTLDDLASRVINPDDGILYARLWRPAADRLLDEIDKLEPEARSLVFSLLVDR